MEISFRSWFGWISRHRIDSKKYTIKPTLAHYEGPSELSAECCKWY